MKVSFPDAPITFDFAVTEETPGKRVARRCLAGPPEWIGTDLSFDVETDADDNTSVLFSHAGWPRPRNRLLVGSDLAAAQEVGGKGRARPVL
jgi:hypothetical protein